MPKSPEGVCRLLSKLEGGQLDVNIAQIRELMRLQGELVEYCGLPLEAILKKYIRARDEK